MGFLKQQWRIWGAFFALLAAPIFSTELGETGKEPYFILSIDGGGIKGVIPATILSRLERDLGYKTGQLFDCIAGTSTGGIIAIGLSIPDPNHPTLPLHDASQLVDLYFRKGREIFDYSWWYRIKTLGGLLGPRYENTGLIQAMKAEYGEVTLEEALTDLVIPSYDFYEGKPFLFKHFRNHPHALSDGYKGYEAALAGSAAPTFFSSEALKDSENPELIHNLADGGLVANNPAEITFRECIKYAELQGRDVYLLSIGTGNVYNPPIHADQSQHWGIVQYTVPIIDSIFDASSMTVDEDMQELSKNTNLHFFRINVPLPVEHGNMDDVSYSNMLFLQEMANVAYDAHFFEGGKIDQKLLDPLRKKMTQPAQK